MTQVENVSEKSSVGLKEEVGQKARSLMERYGQLWSSIPHKPELVHNSNPFRATPRVSFSGRKFWISEGEDKKLGEKVLFIENYTPQEKEDPSHTLCLITLSNRVLNGSSKMDVDSRELGYVFNVLDIIEDRLSSSK